MTTGDDAGAAPRILVVEDEWLIAFMVSDTLEEAGFAVCGPASSVEQARALMAEGPVDLAVLDVNLGTEQSLVLVDELLAGGAQVILTTGYQEEDLPTEFQSIPILGKPFSARNLLDVVNRLDLRSGVQK